jgi:hypothetical protein
VSVVAVATVLAGVAAAQSGEPACSVGFRNLPLALGDLGKGVTPYTATARTTYEHQLPDGSYIRGYMVTHRARDAAGKTMMEQPIACRRDDKGGVQPWMLVRIYDPILKTQLSWGIDDHSGGKVARVFHEARSKPLTPEEQAAHGKRSQAQQSVAGEFKSEDLGTRTIAGVEAHGMRTTRTIPAGEEGNELPLMTTEESWYAKDPGVEVMAIREDPTLGRSTYVIEELTAGEPDAALFAPPAGYRIEDLNPPADSATKP